MEGKKADGVWFEELLCDERLSGTEKLWRDIYRIADEFFLMVSCRRYPLVSELQQYHISICKAKKGKWYILFEEEGMELEVVLKKLRKKLESYKDDHKEYLIQRPGGGEMI